MPWPNLTPQEIASYQMLGTGNPQLGQAQPGMNPQMMQYLQMLQNNPGMQFQQAQGQQQQPTLANMLAARPQGMPAAPAVAGFTASASGGNMSTLLNNPQLLQLLMQHYGGGMGMQ